MGSGVGLGSIIGQATVQNKWPTSPRYSDVMMSAIRSQISGVSIVCSIVCSGADQRKHQSSASLAFVRGIPRWPVVYPHEGPVTRKIFPFHYVIKSDEYMCRQTWTDSFKQDARSYFRNNFWINQPPWVHFSTEILSCPYKKSHYPEG